MESSFTTASAHRKAGNYRQAIDIYDALWGEKPEQFDDWSGWSYSFSLIKMQRAGEALNVCRRLYPAYRNSEILRSVYAQCIYQTQLSEANTSATEILKKAVSAIYDLSPPHNPYSVSPRAIFKYIKILMAKLPPDWREMETWLLKIDPDLLSSEPFSWVGADGKTRQLASPKEEWFSWMIRVKAGASQPKELIDLLDTAKKLQIKWHYNNDIWFERKRAFALKELGKKAEAEKILQKIFRSKKDWFIMSDLAGVTDDPNVALGLLCNACLARGENVMKVKVYEEIARLTKAKNNEIAGLHLCLIAALREENGWSVNDSVLTAIRETGVDLSEQGSSSSIVKKLLPFWRANVPVPERRNGTVSRIFEGGTTGLIDCGRLKYYTRFGKLKESIKVGTPISFTLQDSKDKHGRPSQMAIDLQLIK